MRLYNYLNEYVSQSIYDAKHKKERPPTWILVNKDGERVRSIHDDIKNIKTAIKAWEWKIKEDKHEKNEIYIASIKKSTKNKLAVVIMPGQPEPSFDFKEINA